MAVLLALILTRLLILLLGKAASGDVLPEAVIGLIAFGILTYLPVLLSHRRRSWRCCSRSRAASGTAR